MHALLEESFSINTFGTVLSCYNLTVGHLCNVGSMRVSWIKHVGNVGAHLIGWIFEDDPSLLTSVN